MSKHIAARAAGFASMRQSSCAFGRDLWQKGCRRPLVARFGRGALCEQHCQEVARREQTSHREEVDLLFLQTWPMIAGGWGNETPLRLLSCARLEADTERKLGWDALESAARAGRGLP